ncbi:uncharacterized protein LOC111030895 isoform X2 [Myzus persicae]|nr:uncharacterized protein LOC111030895 isoform X2 [Myzus persicae]
MFFDRTTALTLALFFTTAVAFVGWYRWRNRKIRREILQSCKDCKNNNDGKGFDDQVTKDNLSVILKGNR